MIFRCVSSLISEAEVASDQNAAIVHGVLEHGVVGRSAKTDVANMGGLMTELPNPGTERSWKILVDEKSSQSANRVNSLIGDGACRVGKRRKNIVIGHSEFPCDLAARHSARELAEQQLYGHTSSSDDRSAESDRGIHSDARGYFDHGSHFTASGGPQRGASSPRATAAPDRGRSERSARLRATGGSGGALANRRSRGGACVQRDRPTASPRSPARR